MNDPDCDVLVCGLGPVGLLLATLLGRLGVTVVAVDEAARPYDLPRAAVIDDEVLRIMQGAGLDTAIMREAQVQPGVSYVTAAGRPVLVLRAESGPLGHPPLVAIHQPSLEATLAAAAADLPTVRLRRGVRLDALDQRHDHVVALLTAADGSTEPIASRWVVGCDGARSAVRGRLGIDFGGSSFAQRWLVVDATVDRPLARVPHPFFVAGSERPIVSLPMSPGRHRWEWMLHPGEDAAPFLEPAGTRALLAPWLDGERAEVERAVVYTYHARTAERWRDGRVLLAGDAAHVMPPFAGQGFSSGARDAANLAWKLAAVLAGAPERLLDSYEAERRPHVAAMQQLAVRWGAVVQTRRPRAARARDRLMTTLDGTSPMRWIQQHAKPPPTVPGGAFARRPARVPFRRSVGALFPQPTVGTPDGERRLDDALPVGWVALARTISAAGTLARAQLPVRLIGTDLTDPAGALTAWLDRHGADWVVLRPDRFVFDCGPAGAAAAAGPALRATLGAVAPGP